ncbi:NHL repeat protein [Salpingoeca rosetta]|uniref:NHL repeat protein n=1 Tax=Salpingoeca rosetta (strain ATCC 50818 / BSB-021) TaxID=946362 RepID=F2ULB4_SALR5|nr:NHL repeat protein [Salpingoeca rosetta]EGD77913.1 NHL repeat protein [Salpingoeca rosetta]|eukprot:XP_004989977.1 NHL repeat protein [Salpingoeca rosetta]
MAHAVLVFAVFLLAAATQTQAYVNCWDCPFKFKCPNRQGLAALTSIHSNRREDRRWNFACASAGVGTTGQTSRSGGLDFNQFDRPLSFTCPEDYYLTTLESAHSNNKEDRVWRFECRKIANAYLRGCSTTGYLNGFDQPLNYIASNDRIITGLHSYHNNRKEDRRWKVSTCKVECDLNSNYITRRDRTCDTISESTLSQGTYVNDFQSPFYVTCPDNTGMYEVRSYHDNNQADRRWRYYCDTIGGPTAGSKTGWSSADYSRLGLRHTFSCPDNTYMRGMKSTFVADANDRVFSYQCQAISSATLTNCITQPFQNIFDNALTFNAGTKRVITGILSDYLASAMDRTFHIRTCQVSCATDYVSDGVKPCSALSLTRGSLSGDCQGYPGDVCSYSSCNEGYVLSSTGVTRTCQDSGSWTNSAATCQRVTCGSLSLSHGTLSGSCSGDYGETCTFSRCDDGYAPTSGSTSRTCGYNGWSGSAISCEPVSCPSLSISNGATSGSCNGDYAIDCGSLSLSNGQLAGGCSGSYGDACTYDSCNTNYELSEDGDATRVCQQDGNDGVWTGTAKTCERIKCPTLTVANGAVSGDCDGLSVGDECTVSSCDSGYWFSDSGSRTVTCTEVNGERMWSGSLNTCEAVTCMALSLNHGSVSGSCSGTVGDQCTYSGCDDGFLLSSEGTTTRTCTQNEDTASWSGDAKSCFELLEGASGETFTLSCASGQGFVGVTSDAQNSAVGDRRDWGFACDDVGSNDANRVWNMHEEINSARGSFDFTCPHDSYYISGVTTSYLDSPNDRLWGFQCSLIFGATLGNCQLSSSYSASTFNFDYAVPTGHVLVGVKSSYSTSSGSRSFQFRTCEVQCRTGQEYFSTGGAECQRVGCGALTLENGAVSGSCDGNIGDQCDYEQCNGGYTLSESGSSQRECVVVNDKPQWSGQAKTCERVTTTTAEPTTLDVCSVYKTAPNPTTCRSQCDYYDRGDATFSKSYGECSNVCTCGCRRRFKITKTEERCSAHCADQGLAAAFRDMHLGCRKVCLCVDVDAPTTPAGGALTEPDADENALDFPFSEYNYEETFTGAITGNSNPRRFSTAFETSATIVNMEGESMLQCLRYCDADPDCLGIFASVVNGMLRCQLMSDLGSGTGVSTQIVSKSLTKGTQPSAVGTATPSIASAIQTVVGNGGTTWDSSATLLNTGLNQPDCVTFDGEHEMLVTMVSDHRVIRVDLRTRTSSLVAGTGEMGADGVGGAATSAQLNRPRCAIADVEGNVYITEEGNHRVSVVDVVSKKLSVFAGTGDGGHRGMGGVATAAQIHSPQAMAWTEEGNLLFSDEENHVVYMVNPHTTIISVVAGTPRVAGDEGDGQLAIGARLNMPAGIAVYDHMLYIADSGNHRVRAVDLYTQVITTVAGTGVAGFSGDGGLPTDARLDTPRGVAVHSSGSLAIADSGNHRVREFNIGVGAAGIITTTAGNGQRGYNGDGMVATDTALNFPTGITFSPLTDNVLFVDRRNRRVRQIWA